MKRLVIMLTVGLGVALALGGIFYAGQTATELVNAQEAVEIPFLEEWTSSGHADATAEAFVHWDEETPAEVPDRCAKCHSSPGYLDFIGADDSEAGVVNAPAPIGSVVDCKACHNDVTLTMDSVVMPSGVEITGLGDESRCMQCHQGRASTVQVDESIAEANLTDVDTISPDLGFTNIHYYAAAASKYGTVAKGGYQYEGNSYDANFAHVAEFDTCIECHDSHTLQVRVEACQDCHEGVTTVEDLRDVRMQGSLVDYDGDGNTEEGIYYEIEGLQEMLYQAIQTYAITEAQAPIFYDPATHPYFFLDTNKNGKADPAEINGDNAYNAWTARLAKAAFNYQVSVKDPGAFAHGGKYIIQLLYDSIADLNEALPRSIDLSEAHRIDDGHFAGSEEAFRHWDADDPAVVPGTCAKCHSAEGLPTHLQDGTNISVAPSNGLQCSTCHSDLTTFALYEVSEVEFPSGAVLSLSEGEEAASANLCLNCHQGRESTVSVNELIEGIQPDAQDENLRFLNVHYFAAGATLFGGEAQGAYQYDGQEYTGRFEHVDEASTCVQCHSAHGLQVQVELCTDCHEGVESEEDLQTIRESSDDFDGDGDTEEGLAEEIATMREALYAAMQEYATTEAGAGILYNPQSYPYYFIDTNGNGEVDPDETSGYNAWTPRLLKAAYNYQYSSKDPGAFAHNGLYIIQVLYDSLEDIGADVGDMVRP